MDRSSILALRNPRRVQLFDQLDLEVEIVPSEMPDLSGGRLLGFTSQQVETDVCQRAFTNFWNYEDNGKPVENTLENRLELYRVPIFRQAINNALQAANGEVVLGEGNAASD